ncbi:MAG: NADH-quinone oxidoreductase subunit NuoK [Bacteroidetes bacterium]|nr:NADH-quinone oxidoreductase subunit NuoK [Bacteroidota bacterium]
METYSPTVEHYLVLGTALFFIGMFGFLTRKNMIAMLMSLELMLNGVNIIFVTFNKFKHPVALDGMFFAIFIITIAAAEAALAIAIIISIYKNFKSIESDEPHTLKF